MEMRGRAGGGLLLRPRLRGGGGTESGRARVLENGSESERGEAGGRGLESVTMSLRSCAM